MEGDELRTEAAAANDSAAGDNANRAAPVPSVAEVSRNKATGLTKPSAEKSKDATHPPLNKWQTFWNGVVHIDTAKIEPWIAARNALGVAAPARRRPRDSHATGRPGRRQWRSQRLVL